VLGVGCHLKPTGQPGAQARLFHQFRDPVLATSNSFLVQVPQDPWAAVGLAAGLKVLPDSLRDSFIFPVARAAFAPAPGVVAAFGHPQGATQSGDGKVPHVLLHELVSHWGRFVKIPTAFFKISFSCFKRAFSR
jgi:hypothetical protein